MKAVLSTDRWEADVLGKLGMLMDGAIANYDAGQIQKGKPGSIQPHGDSLYAYHEAKLKRLLKAPGYMRRIAIAEAERDFYNAKRRPPTYDSPDSDQNKRERDAQIVRWLEEERSVIWICVMAGLEGSKDHGKRYVERIRKALKDGTLDQTLMV